MTVHNDTGNDVDVQGKIMARIAVQKQNPYASSMLAVSVAGWRASAVCDTHAELHVYQFMNHLPAQQYSRVGKMDWQRVFMHISVGKALVQPCSMVSCAGIPTTAVNPATNEQTQFSYASR